MSERARGKLRSDEDGASPSYIDPADEIQLICHYLAQIAKMCTAFQFSTIVEATATSFVKRFYLRNSCLDYHPKRIMWVFGRARFDLTV